MEYLRIDGGARRWDLCWRERRTLFKKLVVIAVSAIVIGLIIGILVSKRTPVSGTGVYRQTQNDFSNINNDICLTPECVQLASSILKKMDPTINPCDNFYQFACGTYRKKYIPDDEMVLNLFSKVRHKVKIQVRTLMEEEVQPNGIQPFVSAKNIYKLCMNESRIEEMGDRPLKTLLAEVGEWPVLSKNWNESTFNWAETIYKFRTKGLGNNYLLKFFVEPDDINVTQSVIKLDQAELALSREYAIEGFVNSKVRSYYEYMVDIAVLLGANSTTAKKELKDLLKFEMKLANISLPKEQQRNQTQLHNVLTLGQLQTQFPSIPWAMYITRILALPFGFNESEPIVVTDPVYITNLEKLLDRTPKRVIANYLMWRATESMVEFMPNAYREKQLNYMTAAGGQTARGPRWEECVQIVKNLVPQAVGSAYVRRFFNISVKPKALSLVNRIRQEMYSIIESANWMDFETKKKALDKVNGIISYVGYADDLLDDSKIVKYYGDFKVNDDIGSSIFGAVLNVTRWSTDRSFQQLREPYNRTDWRSLDPPTTVNGLYSMLDNSIQLPAGILQDLFFSENHPNYINYGSIGFVIGHEITHGFDDEGRQYSANGKLMNWWDKGTKAKFDEKVQCIIKQYDNYTDTQVNMKLNGINTQGENIADNGGIKLAYRAYQKLVKEEGTEPRLPGLQQFSPSQMFWLAVANTWCSTLKNEIAVYRILHEEHAPPEFRIKGSMSNSKEFAHDFNCPLGSPMNPEKKCTVW